MPLPIRHGVDMQTSGRGKLLATPSEQRPRSDLRSIIVVWWSFTRPHDARTQVGAYHTKLSLAHLRHRRQQPSQRGHINSPLSNGAEGLTRIGVEELTTL